MATSSPGTDRQLKFAEKRERSAGGVIGLFEIADLDERRASCTRTFDCRMKRIAGPAAAGVAENHSLASSYRGRIPVIAKVTGECFEVTRL